MKKLLKKITNNKKRWVHYGSSISHSKASKTPSTIWTSIIARKLDFHLTNLGFGGNCVLEPMVARIIRDIAADVISLKIGINCYGELTNNCFGGPYSQRTFEPAVIGLIKIIREKHTHTPLFVISPIYSPPREDVKGGSGFSLKDMREVICSIVQKFNKYGGWFYNKDAWA